MTAAGLPDPDPAANRRSAGPDRVELVHAQLRDAVAALTTGPAWQAMLRTAARFHTYSPNNVLLIGAQRPDATCVAGYRTWQSMGRQVRRGETGVVLLAPMRSRKQLEITGVPGDAMQPQGSPADDRPVPEPATRPHTVRGFRPVTVFDIAQTDGPELPVVRPTLLTGDAPPALWFGLAGQVTAAGFQLERGDCGPANGITDHAAHTVTVRPDLSPAQAAKTLAHELAHVLLHEPADRPAGLDRAAAEVEAESVAYVITQAHGLVSDEYTVPYVAGWAGGDPVRLEQTATRVLACAKTVLAAAPPADQLDPHSPQRLPVMARALAAGFTATNPTRARGPARPDQHHAIDRGRMR